MARPTASASKPSRPQAASSRASKAQTRGVPIGNRPATGKVGGTAKRSASRAVSAPADASARGRRPMPQKGDQPPPWLWPVIGGAGGGLFLILFLVVITSGSSPTPRTDSDPGGDIRRSNPIPTKAPEFDEFANDTRDPNWKPDSQLTDRANRAAQHGTGGH